MDLTKILKPGQIIVGSTTVQTDFHVWRTVHGNYRITEVYPHWINCRSIENKVIGGHGDRTRVPAGRRASFTYGDLVTSGVIDPFASAEDPTAALRRP